MKDPLEEIYERRIIADRIAQQLIEHQQTNKEIYQCQYCKKDFFEHLNRCSSCGGGIILKVDKKQYEEAQIINSKPLTTSPLQALTALLIVAFILIVCLWIYSFLQ